MNREVVQCCCSHRCEQMHCCEVATICHTTILVSFWGLSKTYVIKSSWYSHWRTWSTWFLAFWLSSASATSDTSSDDFDAWFLRRAQQSRSHRQCWFHEESLIHLEDTQCYPDFLDVALLLVIIQQSWHNFSEDFLHIPKSLVIIFQTLPFFMSGDHSNSQLTTTTH